jgi:hypothetical protein
MFRPEHPWNQSNPRYSGALESIGLLRTSDSRRVARSRARAARLELFVARALNGTRTQQRYSENIRHWQHQLKRRVSGPAWQLYLSLEEAEIERLMHALNRLAAWALGPRRRARRR